MGPALLGLLWGLGCGGAPEPTPPTAARRAPVVIITLDTTRADHIGAWGYTPAATPNIDALAARGARFARAYAPVPLTIPSHATLHTGLLPPRHGVRDNGDQRLSESAHTLAERLAEAGYRPYAAVAAFVTQAHWGFGQGFVGYYDDLGVPSDSLSWVVERPASAVIDDALAALDAGADMLWVHLFDAHMPYSAPEPYKTAHAGRPYDAELAYIDPQLGRLLPRLPPDAIIVLAGDHGESLGEGGEPEHGLLLSDATTHVPLILVAPGITPQTIDRPVSLADVAPTLLRLAGLAVPTDLDGEDLLLGGPRLGVYSETRYGFHHFGWTPLEALTTATGRVIRGARVQSDGVIDAEAALGELDRITAAAPAWSSERATLDLAAMQQLQALGYVSAGDIAAPSGVDPRDGVLLIRELAELRGLPPDKLEPALRAMLVKMPGNRDLRLRLGTLLLSTGRIDEAVNELTQAHREAPDSSTALLLGEAWLVAGAPDEALSWFTEALNQDPRSVSAMAGQSTCLVRLGRVTEAELLIDEALRRAPDHAEAILAGAVFARARGEPLEPWAKAVEEVAARRPLQAQVWFILGELRLELGLADAGEDALLTELQHHPFSGATRAMLAQLYLEQNRLVDAVKILRPMLNVNPEDPVANALTAQAYLKMKRPERAAPHQARCAGFEGCP